MASVLHFVARARLNSAARPNRPISEVTAACNSIGPELTFDPAPNQKRITRAALSRINSPR